MIEMQLTAGIIIECCLLECSFLLNLVAKFLLTHMKTFQVTPVSLFCCLNLFNDDYPAKKEKLL